jgi:(4S)-4-hydroxy-5-phosphonooxypentane-2,3-dione isomerase
MKLVLLVTVEFEPEFKKDVLRALLAHRDRCLRDEPGTLQFEILVPSEDPSKLFLFELYANDAAFSAHSKGPSLATYREEVKSSIKSVTSCRCSLGNK